MQPTQELIDDKHRECIKRARQASLQRIEEREDVRDVMAVQQHSLDGSYNEHWTDEHGTSELYREIRASVPTI